MVNVRQVRLIPIPDKAPEVRAVLEEQAKSDSQGARTMPGQNMFGELPAFVITSLFDDIEAFEKNRDALWANQAFLDFQAELNPLLRQLAEITLS